MSSSYVSGKVCYGSLHINEGGKLIGEFEFKDKNIVQGTSLRNFHRSECDDMGPVQQTS